MNIYDFLEFFENNFLFKLIRYLVGSASELLIPIRIRHNSSDLDGPGVRGIWMKMPLSQLWDLEYVGGVGPAIVAAAELPE